MDFTNKNVENHILSVEKIFFKKHCEIMELQLNIKNKRIEKNNFIQKKNKIEKNLSKLFLILNFIADHDEISDKTSYMYKADELEREIKIISNKIKELNNEEDKMRTKVMELELETTAIVKENVKQSN